MNSYDAVVVGARCAGAATALLMARTGMRVLLVDRVPPTRDTLSTHALMRAGVLQLDRWGLLERLAAAGTPPVVGTTFHYADRSDPVELAQPLYAPRRTVLDAMLVEAAREAGVECRFGIDVTGVLRDDGGRVTGVTGRARGAQNLAVRTALTVGADGLRSTVARLVGARTTHRGRAASALVYGYWPAPGADRYEWFYRPGATAGVIPTNDGEVCVWVGLPPARFLAERADGLDALFARTLRAAAPEVLDLIAPDARTGPLRGFPGAPGHLRQAFGPGWALVGDAGYFKDPLTAHGITDALRDAELLARAAATGDAQAMAGYERTRDVLARPLLAVAESIVGYRWDTAEIRRLLDAERLAFKPEVALVRGFDDAPARAA
jgi:flavin-dependent dehydrogenase